MKVNLSKEWCLEMALREGESEVGAGARHDYLLHETIEALLRCPLCAEQVRSVLSSEAAPDVDCRELYMTEYAKAREGKLTHDAAHEIGLFAVYLRGKSERGRFDGRVTP